VHPILSSYALDSFRESPGKNRVCAQGVHEETGFSEAQVLKF